VTITVRNKETDAVARQTLFATADADGSVATRFKADPYKNLGSYEVTASDGRSSSTMSYQVVGDGESLNAAVGSQLRTYRLALLTDPAYATFFGPANVPDVWSIKKVNPQSMVHLTEKPVELARRAIEFSSRPGENVLDLFGGSGSTLIGAEMTAPPRRAFLMELDTLYCDVILQPPTLGEVHGPQGSSVANDNGPQRVPGSSVFPI
jgi:hypothetical protein